MKIENVVVLEKENPQQCDYCGKVAELRPYGKNGAAICFECATKPENKAEMEKQFRARLSGVKPQGKDFKP